MSIWGTFARKPATIWYKRPRAPESYPAPGEIALDTAARPAVSSGMRREVALLGGAFDGEVYEVEDSDAYLVLATPFDGGAVVYHRALAIDAQGRPVFAMDGIDVKRTSQ